MQRTRVNLGIVLLCRIQLIPGAPEKGARKNPRQPYPEPAQVPLAEKAKA